MHKIKYPRDGIDRKYVFIFPTPLHGQDVTQGQFYAEFNRFECSFLFPRLVA